MSLLASKRVSNFFFFIYPKSSGSIKARGAVHKCFVFLSVAYYWISVLPMSYKSSLHFFLNTKLTSITTSDELAYQSQELQDLQTTLCHSLDFLNAIEKLSQTRSEGVSTSPAAESIDLYGMLRARPLRQGPFLMQPSPIELNVES